MKHVKWNGKLKGYTFDQDIDSIPWLEDLVIEVEYEWKESYLVAPSTYLQPAEYSEPEIEISEAYLIAVNEDLIKMEVATKGSIKSLKPVPLKDPKHVSYYLKGM